MLIPGKAWILVDIFACAASFLAALIVSFILQAS
jgi:hypothetical protein